MTEFDTVTAFYCDVINLEKRHTLRPKKVLRLFARIMRNDNRICLRQIGWQEKTNLSESKPLETTAVVTFLRQQWDGY